MKKSVRNTKSKSELSKILEMHRLKKIIIFFCEYIRMVVITVQTYKNAEVHTITEKNKKKTICVMYRRIRHKKCL